MQCYTAEKIDEVNRMVVEEIEYSDEEFFYDKLRLLMHTNREIVIRTPFTRSDQVPKRLQDLLGKRKFRNALQRISDNHGFFLRGENISYSINWVVVVAVGGALFGTLLGGPLGALIGGVSGAAIGFVAEMVGNNDGVEYEIVIEGSLNGTLTVRIRARGRGADPGGSPA
ncbi:MAG: hypothetical protein RKO66_00805 [Candidatus Contendobacter sp.]|nr:hypothetical protein [Candidatus Contendobacter sp.]